MDKADVLLAQAKAGDLDALTELLATHDAEIRSAVRIAPRWRSLFHIDDIMQITWIEVRMGIARFKPNGPDSFLAWVRRIAQNALRGGIREMQRQKRPDPRHRVALNTGDDSAAASPNAMAYTSTTPSRIYAGCERDQILLQVVARLPSDYARVIRLYDLDERTVAEVAERLGTSTGAIHMRRRRAWVHLRKALGSESSFFSVSRSRCDATTA